MTIYDALFLHVLLITAVATVILIGRGFDAINVDDRDTRVRTAHGRTAAPARSLRPPADSAGPAVWIPRVCLAWMALRLIGAWVQGSAEAFAELVVVSRVGATIAAGSLIGFRLPVELALRPDATDDTTEDPLPLASWVFGAPFVLGGFLLAWIASHSGPTP